MSSSMRQSLDPKYKDLCRNFERDTLRYKSLSPKVKPLVDKIIDADGCGCCEDDDLFILICDLADMVK